MRDKFTDVSTDLVKAAWDKLKTGDLSDAQKSEVVGNLKDSLFHAAEIVPHLLDLETLPLSVVLVGSCFSAVGFVVFRYRSRIPHALSGLVNPQSSSSPRQPTRAVVYGAGELGQLLVRRLRTHADGRRYRVVGFLDDDSSKHGLTVHGIKVVGGRGVLRAFVAKENVDVIVLAMGSTTGSDMRDILAFAHGTAAQIKVAHDLVNWMGDRYSAALLRDMRAEDLIGRQAAWNAAGYSIPLKPGDRIITGRDEYGSAVLAYFQIARRTGAEVVVIDNDESGQIDLDALRAEVDERTALIGLTWIPTAGGLINPAAEVGAIARDADTLFLLDATQAVGQLPVDVAALGCDLLTGTGRKFLRGPRGTGFLWVGNRALDRVDPPVVEIESADWDGAGGFEFAKGARRFATWEASYATVIGLGAAVRQALELGLDEIAERAVALGARLRAGLAEIPGVTTHDLGERQCAIVTAAVAGHEPGEVKARLAEDGINVSTTVARHTPFDAEVRAVHPLVRLSPHYYNTEAEIDRAVTAVARIAAG